MSHLAGPVWLDTESFSKLARIRNIRSSDHQMAIFAGGPAGGYMRDEVLFGWNPAGNAHLGRTATGRCVTLG